DMKTKAAEPPKQVAIGQAPAPAAVEVPKDCSVLIIGGPQADYPAPAVAAIKNYIDGGGRALVMLDNTVPVGREAPAAENAELVKLISQWGVTFNKDLVLDLSGLGQLFGLGPEVPLVANYESHPITQPLSKGVPSAFPLSRSLTTTNMGTAS